jgi:hypothetical protein
MFPFAPFFQNIVEQYSVPLALQDFMPVALSATGLFFLAEMIKHMVRDTRVANIALLGAWLVMLGGGIKAAWKLNVALTGNDIEWMDNALFVLMGPGFTCIAWALSAAQRLARGQALTSSWAAAFPFIVSAVFLATAGGLAAANPGSRIWFFILLGMTTIANFTLSGLAIRQSWSQNLKWVAALFLINVLAILLLQGLARMGDRGETEQWVEQILNTLSNTAFAFAAYKLNRHTLSRLVSRAAPTQAVA